MASGLPVKYLLKFLDSQERVVREIDVEADDEEDAIIYSCQRSVRSGMRDWVTNVRTTHYLLGSVLGAHPYPTMVRDFHRVIGREARKQILQAEGKLPTAIIACVGGGSNAIGIFYDFVKDKKVQLIGVEAGGRGEGLGDHDPYAQRIREAHFPGRAI